MPGDNRHKKAVGENLKALEKKLEEISESQTDEGIPTAVCLGISCFTHAILYVGDMVAECRDQMWRSGRR